MAGGGGGGAGACACAGGWGPGCIIYDETNRQLVTATQQAREQLSRIGMKQSNTSVALPALHTTPAENL